MSTATENGSTQHENYLDRWYREYVTDILENGRQSGDRTGTGTTKTFGHQARFDLKKGFPLLTTKAVWFDGIVRELLWFLRGQTNIWYLLQDGVSIWTGNAYARYENSREDYYQSGPRANLTEEEFEAEILRCPPPHQPSEASPTFAEIWGDLGPIYGKQWRAHNSGRRTKTMLRNCDREVDQIQRLIEGLETHPDSRRHLVSAWDPSVHGIEGEGESRCVGLSPCHYGFQCYTERMTVHERYRWAESQGQSMNSYHVPKTVSDDHEEWHSRFDRLGIPRRSLSLMWNQRSVDSFLGLPFNIASYALLTHLLARHVGMAADEVIFSGGDCHIYDNHRDQVQTQISRVGSSSLPTLSLPEGTAEDIGDYSAEEFSVEQYAPADPISAEMAA